MTIKLIIYICMLGVWMLPVSVIILFSFRIVLRMCYFLFSILLYYKTNYIYICMYVAYFYDNFIWFWNCFNNVVFFVFHFIIYILPFFLIYFATSWWWYVYISRFHISLPICLDPSSCSYSSGCIYAIFVLLVVSFLQC